MNTRTKTILSLFGVGCLIVASALITMTRLHPVAPLPAARSAPIAATDSQSPPPGVEALQEELAELKRQVAKLAAAGPGRPADPSADELTALRRQVAALQRDRRAEAGDPPTAAEAERQRQAQIVETEAAFRREGLDSRWADTAVTAVTEALTSEESAPLDVRDLECRAQSCRLEIAVAPGDVADQGLALALHRVATTLPNGIATHTEDPDGTRHTIIYLTRETKRAPAPH